MNEVFLKVKDVAQVLNISERSLQRLLQSGAIKAVKIHNKWRIPERSVLVYVESLMKEENNNGY